MEALEERIRRDGKILPGNMIRVDSFLNHQIDAAFLGEIADEFAKMFDLTGVTKILTAEASGIALATVCAYKFGLPMVFAKKSKCETLPESEVYQSDIFSYSYRRKVTLVCSREWIGPADTVLIIDDFMGNGEAMRGLLDIVRQSGARLAGVGVAIEKGFQHGGDRLREQGVPIRSLAIIDSADQSGFTFRRES